MAAENQQTINEGNHELGPPQSELSAGEIPGGAAADLPAFKAGKELPEREVFAGDEDFYKSLADSFQSAGASQPVPSPIRDKRFSGLQKALVAGIVVITAILLYALLKSPAKPVTDITPIPPTEKVAAAQQSPRPEPSAVDTAPGLMASPQQIQVSSHAAPAGVGTSARALSLKVAHTFYLQKDYDKAYAAYDRLRQTLPMSTENKFMKDFLRLRMAFCMKKAADSDAAGRLFAMASQSRCPAVKVIADWQLSLIEIQRGQYLKARTRAYQAIALIDAVDFDRNWASSLQRDCYFLAAECLTRNVLSLCDADKDIPEDLWSSSDVSDEPFANLSEAQLHSLLDSGSKQLSKALLSPRVRELTGSGTPGTSRWSVTCYGAPIEELLARFAANAGLGIYWALGNDSAGIRKRPVSLYMPAATTQQLVTAAAGCAGLLARQGEQRNTDVFLEDPTKYSSLSEHVSLLGQEAISLWRRFLLAFHDDKRTCNAHFALGLLQAQKGQTAEAIAEYKLVANRFSQTSLAPFALLHSSKLKANLRDYPGAMEDLKQVVEQHPDAEVSNRACLYLADATMKAGFKSEAARLYRKVYNLGSSLESRAAAALGAGRCFYEEEDYENAAKWLTRYIDLAEDRTDTELYSAYFLLGKTLAASGKHQQACNAFSEAMEGQRRRAGREYVETVSALVKGYMEQQRFVEALDVLENMRSAMLSHRESIEISLLKSKTLRAMGLVDKAIAELGDRAEYITETQLKAEISFELSNCYIAGGKLELASRNLTRVLTFVEPGPLAHGVAVELAGVCLRLGQDSQAISVCSQLLDLGPEERIKQKALNILAAAYNRQKNYDRAVLALLGRWDGDRSQVKTGQSTQ